MTPTRDLATNVARAVIDRIATDRLCNSENIGDAVFRELAMAAVKPEQGGSSYAVGRLLGTAQEMLMEIATHIPPQSQPSCFYAAQTALEAALREFQVL